MTVMIIEGIEGGLDTRGTGNHSCHSCRSGRSTMADRGDLGRKGLGGLDVAHRECLLHWQLFVWEYGYMALDAGLCLVRHRVLTSPLSLADLALELSVALLATLVRCQLVVRRVEAHGTVGDVMSMLIADMALILVGRRLLG